MYERVLCVLMLLVIVRAKEISTVKPVEIVNFLDSRLSTVLYTLPYNDEYLTKDNTKRSLVLLTPLSRNEHEKSKETVQKTKRCGMQSRKNKFLLLSTKEDIDRAIFRNTDKNINLGIPKQNSNNIITKSARYSRENSAISNKMNAETYKDKILLQTLKDNLNADDITINLESQKQMKKCNTEKYICHCKEENCFSNSSEKNSSKMLGSSRIDKPERINQQRLIKHGNIKSGILQQKSPKLYYENPYKSHVPNLVNYFLIQPYQEKMRNIHHVPILYRIPPNILPHMVGNSISSFDDKSNYLIRNNAHDEYPSVIRQNPCVCSPVTEKHRIESSSVSTTSSSTNYDDSIIARETENDIKSNNPIGSAEEDEKYFSILTTEVPNVGASVDLKTETNFHSNYLTTDESEESNTVNSFNLNEIIDKDLREDFTEEKVETDQDNLPKLTSLADIDTSIAPSIIHSMNDEKFINMEECIQLFGRDVCVLSATPPRMLAKQKQKDNSIKYSMITIPEYVTQPSRKETTLNAINYLNNLKTIDPFFTESSTSKIETSTVNLNEYFESTSTKISADVNKDSLRKSIKQIYKPDVNYDKNKLFNFAENTPIKKLKDQTVDETIYTDKNKLLGKSKSHTTKLLLNPNNEETASDEKVDNLKINHENCTTDINFTLNIPSEGETTVINDNSETEYNFNEKNRNYTKKSDTDINLKKEISQEYFKKETTTISFVPKTDYETRSDLIGIEANINSKEMNEGQTTTTQYFDDKISDISNKKDNISNLETIVDSSISKLPFCDNTLLLNSIRKVINDFALDARLAKTQDLDENSLQMQGKNLLPEILQVPYMKNILMVPQIEKTIIEKVKDVLSYVTAIPRSDFTNDWSHGVIKNTLHSILEALSDFHHKLPPMTLEEHQFKDGQWRTNLVTLAPVVNQKLSTATPENLRESIKNLLSSSAIASQADQHIVRNMIVQSVKNSLANDKDEKIDDLITYALNDLLQSLKNSKDINILNDSNEYISDEEDTGMIFSQKIPMYDYEIGINTNDSILNSKDNLDVKEDTKVDNKTMQITDYQETKTLENNVNVLITSESPYLSSLYKEKEEKIINKVVAKTEENIRNQNLNEMKKTNMQDDVEKKLAAPKIIYHKAILQNNPSMLATSELKSENEEYIKNHPIDNEAVKITPTTTNFMQETSPNYEQMSNGIILENVVEIKDSKEEHILNEKTSTTSLDEIDPIIILERIKSNLPPTKYYSPEIIKYVTDHHTDDKNVEITTAPTNFIQEISSNYAQISDDLISKNIAETKDERGEMESPLISTVGNLISSTNIEYRDYEPETISLIDKNNVKLPQQNFTENNVIKIHEVTTEVQRTYAKTTYFKTEPSTYDNSRINSSSLIYKITDINNNDNENKNSNSDNIIGNRTNNSDNVAKAKERIVSSSKSSVDDSYSSQSFPSSITSNDISELQKSRLYYINDDVKLPLEIRKLKDGSYALSISKNICEFILKRKCPCCVPLQGYIVQLKNQHEEINTMISTTMEKRNQEDMYENDIKKDYRSIQPLNLIKSSMITKENDLTTQKLKEEDTSTHNLWKRNMNDDNLAIISMPVVDFVKKYNLSLDFNEDEHNQSEERTFNNYEKIGKDRLLDKDGNAVDEFQNLIKVREKKNSPTTSFPIFPITQKFFDLGKNFIEIRLRKANTEMNPFEIDQELKLGNVKTTNDVSNMNIVRKMNFKNQDITQDITQGNISRKEENKQHGMTELINHRKNVPEIEVHKENVGRPYRYQRNTNGVVNQRAELVKSMLYWLKSLF
ncbi:hypothetical protein P5V15_005335 [Pogonomyrmex californicus]